MDKNRSDFISEVDGERIPVIAGDWNDDDAKYVDELIDSAPEPPNATELPQEENTLPAYSEPRRNNRLLSRTASYADNASAIQVLPEDSARYSVTVYSGTVACYVADNRDTLSGPGTSNAFLVPAGSTVQLVGYTGPVYLAPAGVDGSTVWTYSVSAVTE